ncbi:helix-hairpin-helix domain-containing protein [Thermosynechococcaceae cyanobacterium BACA0444]|uniref:Helix-hairpin-helix domain-containing protein n=1 Tax=Pseudocalidococcus azoricus BACA0444 TaxID=2918990 RepID=A0AAE4K0Z2_9CYAN|nr:ParB N-terminal domain-containing protein [Pseudocalidococcus azoricus]MDS3862317.1 helix-hairpin-helix domain-containing protein [Pseudocalidococcus azoricus BACA0444]
MSDYLDQNEQIYRHLKPRELIHGEIYTESIIEPKSSLSLDDKKIELIRNSLVRFHGNISPLIVRRVHKEDDTFYEILHGADVFYAAKSIKLEKLSAWVLKLTDDEVEIAKQEICQLMSPIDLYNLEESLKTLQEQENKLYLLQKKRLDTIDRILKIINPVSTTIKINSVSLEDLMKIKGIKNTSARKIIDKRPYTDIQDFANKQSRNIVNALKNCGQIIVFD